MPLYLWDREPAVRIHHQYACDEIFALAADTRVLRDMVIDPEDALQYLLEAIPGQPDWLQ